jgi:hypothetical protein
LIEEARFAKQDDQLCFRFCSGASIQRVLTHISARVKDVEEYHSLGDFEAIRGRVRVNGVEAYPKYNSYFNLHFEFYRGWRGIWRRTVDRSTMSIFAQLSPLIQSLLLGVGPPDRNSATAARLL